MKLNESMLEHPLSVEIRKTIVKGLAEFNMITEGDHVMVAVSGGKDSSILLVLLNEIRRRVHFNYTLEAVMLDQKQPGFDAREFRRWVEGQGVKFTLLEEDTYSIVKEKVPEGKTYCSLCSRLRRGILYNYAFENQFTKIALGHHRDDLIETVLMNMFYSSRLASMPPKLKSDDGRNILIRPLCYVPERKLIDLQKLWNFPVVPCKLCGSQEGLKRERVRQLIEQLEMENPVTPVSILNSLGNIEESQMMDHHLWDFNNL